MKKELFSQEALERLRSPEQLDTMLVVTQPAAWMSLLALLFLTASILLWGVFGRLSETVDTVGMIMDNGGVATVVHSSSGKVDSVLVQPDRRVKKGDIIATISQPLLDSEVVIGQQKMDLSGNMQDSLARLSQFDTTLLQRDIHRFVTSEHDGVVTEVQVKVGDMVSAGNTSICSIRLDHDREDVLAVMYVGVESGKKVKPGMVVRLEPSSADVRQTGHLLGTVREVGRYPSSSAGMVNVMGNPEVTSWILNQIGGAGVEVKVSLIHADTPSGYLWSSIVGDPPIITAGDVCKGTVVVESKPPLEKIFLKLSQWLRTL
ncbi:MAG: biotin/lipoyl-binding protein [Planctomycetes bacterium]|nr:biotin/lipoyl-binding protein [Planctomycetota bacterium]